MRCQIGFSLLEVIIVIGVLALITGAGATLTSTIAKSYADAHAISEKSDSIESIISYLDDPATCARNFAGLIPPPCIFASGTDEWVEGGQPISDILRTDNRSLLNAGLQQSDFRAVLCRHDELSNQAFQISMRYRHNQSFQNLRLPIGASFNLDGSVKECGWKSSSRAPVICPTPTPTPSPTPGPGCGGTIHFAGSIKVNDPWGGGSAGTSCQPLVGINVNIAVPNLSAGQSATVVGVPPWPSTQVGVGTWDGPGCDRTFFFGEFEVQCDNSNNLNLTRVGNIRYYSGRIDQNVYILRATFDSAANCVNNAGVFTCAGNDPLARITVNPGFTVEHVP